MLTPVCMVPKRWEVRDDGPEAVAPCRPAEAY